MQVDLHRYLSPTGTAEQDGDVAESFHEATKWTPALIPASDARIRLHLYDERAVLETSRNQKRYANRPIEPLPRPKLRDAAFERADAARTSCRSFDGTRIGMQQISSILSSIRARRRAQSTIHPDAIMHFRAYPSGGALYPVETYFALPDADRKSWQLSHYAPVEHGATALGSVASDRLTAALQDRDGLHAQAGMIVMLSMVLRRSMTKYGPMGYRFALLEAGAMLQQILLAATDIGIASLVWGSAYDDRVNDLFGLDGVDETMLITLVLGGQGHA